MRILLVSDIHSNLVAFETVLQSAGSFDTIWCMGDTIGYGPRPNECVALIREHASVTISGNHDLACLGRIDLNDFNADARKANIWNGRQLHNDHTIWMNDLLPQIAVDSCYALAHGSPREPVWEYLLSVEAAVANFALMSQRVCFIGHSHVQIGFRQMSDAEHVERFMPNLRHVSSGSAVVDLSDHCRFFINPGSVGQPRDQDPRAAYAILDTDAATVTFARAAYAIAQTQRQMAECGLPTALIRRLEYGM